MWICRKERKEKEKKKQAVIFNPIILAGFTDIKTSGIIHVPKVAVDFPATQLDPGSLQH